MTVNIVRVMSVICCTVVLVSLKCSHSSRGSGLVFLLSVQAKCREGIDLAFKGQLKVKDLNTCALDTDCALNQTGQLSLMHDGL